MRLAENGSLLVGRSKYTALKPLMSVHRTFPYAAIRKLKSVFEPTETKTNCRLVRTASSPYGDGAGSSQP